MRLAPLLAVALLVALAGCGFLGVGGDGSAPNGTDSTPAGTPPPAPETDVIGWEDGYWHNSSVAANNSDGLNASERAAVTARAKARVEYVRGLEFDGNVSVSVISRENFSAASGGNTSEALRDFDNAKFEALMLIGGGTDSIETQEDSLNASVAGYYSPDRDAIVIVSDSPTPTFQGERTLAHELVHALQDQHFALGDQEAATSRDAHNGRNGLIEGDPQSVQFDYLDRCGEEWSCIQAPESDGEGGASNASTPNLGVYLLQFFPYSDGPGFVASLRDGDDWSAVNAAYESPPGSATEVIYPERYGNFQPREATLTDDLRGGWERVRPPNRPDHGRLGQSGLAAMFAYTLYDDYNRSAVVDPRTFLNTGPTGMSINETDPINYDIPPVRGWTGDRFHAYADGDELAYRWRLTWESNAAAQRFASEYRGLLQHWGGEATGDGHWRLPADSPFAGRMHVAVNGDTVTLAHADTSGDLADVAPAAR